MVEILAQATASSTSLSGLGVAGAAAGFTADAPPITNIIAGLINVVLGLTGIVFLVLLVYAGVLYLTAGGAEDNVKKAKKLIANAIIGIILIVAAYAITSYVFTLIVSGTTTPPTTPLP